MKNIGKVWWLIFLLFLSCGHVFSQETEGIQISDRLYTFLTEKNMNINISTEYMQDKYKIAIFFGKKCYMNGYIKYNLTDFLFSVFKCTKSGRLLQKCDVPSSMLII